MADRDDEVLKKFQEVTDAKQCVACNATSGCLRHEDGKSFLCFNSTWKAKGHFKLPDGRTAWLHIFRLGTMPPYERKFLATREGKRQMKIGLTGK